jgi:hypothetical protein
LSNAGYRFAVELFREDGGRLGQVPVTPDWEPAFEQARFDGIRRGLLPALAPGPAGTIEPVWHATAGEPYVSALRAVVGPAASDIPTAYFNDLVRAAGARLVEAGTLGDGDTFRFLVTAYPAAPAASAPAGGGLAVEEIPQPLGLEETSLQPYLDGSLPCGTEGEDDVPVFIPPGVLDETRTLARAAGEVETGGVLVGRLHHDAARPEVFVEVTAQIPARHTVPGQTKLTFTAETWAAVAAAMVLRDRGERMVGWWHYHPDFCRKCPPENRARCRFARPFFSAEDVHLHRVCFAPAWAVALLVSECPPPRGLETALFGWRGGMVTARGFRVLGTAAPEVSAATGEQGGEHAQDTVG